MAWLWLDLSQLKYSENDSDAEIKHHFIRGLLTLEGCENYNQLLCSGTDRTDSIQRL